MDEARIAPTTHVVGVACVRSNRTPRKVDEARVISF